MVKIKNNRFGKANSNLYDKDTMYVGNISFPQSFELFESADHETAAEILTCFIITGVAVIILCQISVSSRPETVEFIDSLDSVKHVKSKIINAHYGMTTSACIAITSVFPYAMDDLCMDGDTANKASTIAKELVATSKANVKRIKPDKNNWLPSARGELGAIKGQMLSCPSTNLRIINIDGTEVLSYDLETAINKLGFHQSTLEKHKISVDKIRDILKKIFLTDNGGIPIDKVVYEEPSFVRSRVQTDILGDLVVRTGELKTKLVKGQEPSTTLSKASLAKYLSKDQLFAYQIAIRTGDTQMARKLTNIAVAKSKE